MQAAGDFESMLDQSIVTDAGLDHSVDALLSHLLSNVPGYSVRSTDGVIFEHSRIADGRAVASGVAVMIDQTVEPLRVEFTLVPSGARLLAGSVHFGDKTRTIGYGSREDRKLRKAMLVDPTAEFLWKERFHRDADGWHHIAV